MKMFMNGLRIIWTQRQSLRRDLRDTGKRFWIAAERTAIQKISTLREKITPEARGSSKIAPSAIFEDQVSRRSL
jgi:hypothetical protein